MRRIAVIGTGYVGLVTGACLADFGNVVVCLDIEESKVDKLKRGILPIYEPGLKELLDNNIRRGRLSFSSEIPFGIKSSEIIFIAVGTPALPDGDVDISDVIKVAETIAEYMEDYKVVVNKSTVSVGTGALVEQIIKDKQKFAVDFEVVSNPEFLREGSAIEDFMRPDRVVIGAKSDRAFNIMADVYRALFLIETPVVKTDVETAEMIKYASNAFLAMKISFVNEIANICEGYDADITVVSRAMGLDRRIGPKFLQAGAGYGGSCFPKDVLGLISIAKKVGVDPDILKAVVERNAKQKVWILEKLKKLVGDFEGKTVALLGLSFKPNTDDIRESPSLSIIRGLLEGHARVKTYDPVAMDAARIIFPEVEYCNGPLSAVEGVNAVVLMTEWNEFIDLDLPKVKELMVEPNFLDCRNVYDPSRMKEIGFNYSGIGRGER